MVCTLQIGLDTVMEFTLILKFRLAKSKALISNTSSQFLMDFIRMKDLQNILILQDQGKGGK